MPKDIQAHLRNETVAEFGPRPGLRVGPTTTVREAVTLMQEERSGCVLVCEEGKLLGIFTEQDYVRRVLHKHLDGETPIIQCMSGNPKTIRLTDSVAALIDLMHKGRLRRLPVVDDDGNVVGCVSVTNLVHHLAEHFPAAVYKLAPVSKPVQQQREGA